METIERRVQLSSVSVIEASVAQVVIQAEDETTLNDSMSVSVEQFSNLAAIAGEAFEFTVEIAQDGAQQTVSGLEAQAADADSSLFAALTPGEEAIAALLLANLAVAPPQPTAEQLAQALVMAQLANAAYPGGSLPPELMAEGWTVARGYPVTDRTTGFRAVLYLNTNGQAVLAFAGTTMLSAADWRTNLRQAVGILAKQYEYAILMTQTLRAQYHDNLQLTGHSLGGGLASAAALVSGDLNATVFNAAGVNPRTVTRHNGSMALADELITSYRINGDPLTLTQRRVIDPLRLIPDNIGTTFELPAGQFTVNPHGMTAVLSALDGNP